MASEKIVKTTCQACDQSCGILVHVKDGKIVKIEGDPEHPVSEGMVCPKGLAQTQVVYHPDRLKYPLKRAGERGEGKWQRISWDEALDTIASKFTEIQQKYGKESIAAVIGGFPRRNFTATRILADSLGTPNWGWTDAIYCWGTHYVAESVTWGGHRRITEAFVIDIDNTNCVVVWGGNPVQTHTLLARRIMKARARGAKLIVIDPRLTATASKADLWLQLRPGTDGALALGMLNVIINEGLYDADFVDKWCVGFEELRQRVQEYPVEKVAEITWVPAEDIKKAARMYATTKPAILYARVAPGTIANSTQAIQAINLLLAITGNMDVKGGNVFRCFPKGYLTRGFFFDKERRLPDEVQEKRLGAKEYPLLCGPRSCIGVIHAEILIKAMLTGEPYWVKALIAANNLLLCLPNSREVLEALKKLDFFMVEELFMTPTAQWADIVLPCTHFFEIEECIDRFMNVITVRRKVIEPVGECRDEMRITFDIAKRMGRKFTIWPELEGAEEWEDHLYENMQLAPIGMTFDDLKKKGFIVTPMKYQKYDRILTPSGKVELYSSVLKELGYDPLPHYVEPFESPISTPELTKEYPLIFITGSRQLAYQHSLGHQIPWLRELVPDPIVEIHPETAEKLGIKDGDWVWIETPRMEGQVKQKAKLTPGIHPQVVNAMAHWWYPEKPAPDHGCWESNINVVMSGDPPYEEISGTPPIRGLLCKIYKVAEG